MASLESFHRRLVTEGAKNIPERCLLFLLLPLSVLYGVVNWLRGKCYDFGLFSSCRAEVPVISVGNLAVGGTGKTPVVDWLLKAFLQAGKRPAVISRGYGGSFTGEVGVVSAANGLLLQTAEAGDEPYLLARRNPQALVLIARNRSAGVQCAVKEHSADVVILDDGFQHRAVARDLDLLLLDARRPFGNGLPLPGGLLREFSGALKRADLLLFTRAESTAKGCFNHKPSWSSRHQIADYAVDLSGRQVSFLELKGKKFLAFCGIAKPESFFNALTTAGLVVKAKLPLGDHVEYAEDVLTQISIFAKNCDAILTTEKDAVKLSAEMFNLPCYQVPMNIEIDYENELLAEINQRLWSQ